MAKTTFKLGTFVKPARRGEDTHANIVLDGKEIGWVERCMSEKFEHAASMRRVYSVSHYDIILTEAAPGGEWEITGIEEFSGIRAAIKARLADVARAGGCGGCVEIAASGVSTAPHTCGKTTITASEAGLHGADFDSLRGAL